MSVVKGYAAAFVEVARAEGALDTVGGELLTFSRALDTAPDLQRTLTDSALPVEQIGRASCRERVSSEV